MRFVAFTCAIAAMGMHPVVAAPTNAPLTATEIVRRSDDLLRGDESYSEMTMTITRPRWARSVTMAGWTAGTDKMFIRILSPKKEKGITFLKKGREAWNYIPAIDRVIKLPPSMMLQSWMGSDFTNDDVVRADSIVTDYRHQIVAEPTIQNEACWTVNAIPKPQAPVVWGKISFTIRKSTFVPIRVDFFDEDNDLIKYYETSDIKQIEGRFLATKLTMHSEIDKGNSTSITYNKITFKPDIKKDRFSLRQLKR